MRGWTSAGRHDGSDVLSDAGGDDDVAFARTRPVTASTSAATLPALSPDGGRGTRPDTAVSRGTVSSAPVRRLQPAELLRPATALPSPPRLPGLPSRPLGGKSTRSAVAAAAATTSRPAASSPVPATVAAAPASWHPPSPAARMDMVASRESSVTSAAIASRSPPPRTTESAATALAPPFSPLHATASALPLPSPAVKARDGARAAVPVALRRRLELFESDTSLSGAWAPAAAVAPGLLTLFPHITSADMAPTPTDRRAASHTPIGPVQPLPLPTALSRPLTTATITLDSPIGGRTSREAALASTRRITARTLAEPSAVMAARTYGDDGGTAAFLAEFSRARRLDRFATVIQAWWRALPTIWMYRFIVRCRRRHRAQHLKAWQRVFLAARLHRLTRCRHVWWRWVHATESSMDVRFTLQRLGDKFVYAKTPVSAGSYSLAVHMVLSPRGQEIMARRMLTAARRRMLLAPYLAEQAAAAAAKARQPKPAAQQAKEAARAAFLRLTATTRRHAEEHAAARTTALERLATRNMTGHAGASAGGGGAKVTQADRARAYTASLDAGALKSFPMVRVAYRRGLAELGVRVRAAPRADGEDPGDESPTRAHRADDIAFNDGLERDAGAGAEGPEGEGGSEAAAGAAAAAAAQARGSVVLAESLTQRTAEAMSRQANDPLVVLQQTVDYYVKRQWFGALKALLAEKRAQLQRGKVRMQQVARLFFGADPGWDTGLNVTVLRMWRWYAYFRRSGGDAAATVAAAAAADPRPLPQLAAFISYHRARNQRKAAAADRGRVAALARTFRQWQHWVQWWRRVAVAIRTVDVRWQQRQARWALHKWQSRRLAGALTEAIAGHHFRAWRRWVLARRQQRQRAEQLRRRLRRALLRRTWNRIRRAFAVDRTSTAIGISRLLATAAPGAGGYAADMVVATARDGPPSVVTAVVQDHMSRRGSGEAAAPAASPIGWANRGGGGASRTGSAAVDGLDAQAAVTAISAAARTDALQVVLSARADPVAAVMSTMVSCWRAWRAYAHRRSTWVRFVGLYRLDAARHLLRLVWREWAFYVVRKKANLLHLTNSYRSALGELSPRLGRVWFRTAMEQVAGGEYDAELQGWFADSLLVGDNAADGAAARSAPTRAAGATAGDGGAAHAATRRGDLTALHAVVAADHQAVHVRDAAGNTPLHIAASRLSSGFAPLIVLLLHAGARPLMTNAAGRTAIDCAVNPALAAIIARHVYRLQAQGFTGVEGRLMRRWGRHSYSTINMRWLIPAAVQELRARRRATRALASVHATGSVAAVGAAAFIARDHGRGTVDGRSEAAAAAADAEARHASALYEAVATQAKDRAHAAHFQSELASALLANSAIREGLSGVRAEGASEDSHAVAAAASGRRASGALQVNTSIAATGRRASVAMNEAFGVSSSPGGSPTARDAGGGTERGQAGGVAVQQSLQLENDGADGAGAGDGGRRRARRGSTIVPAPLPPAAARRASLAPPPAGSSGVAPATIERRGSVVAPGNEAVPSQPPRRRRRSSMLADADGDVHRDAGEVTIQRTARRGSVEELAAVAAHLAATVGAATMPERGPVGPPPLIVADRSSGVESMTSPHGSEAEVAAGPRRARARRSSIHMAQDAVAEETALARASEQESPHSPRYDADGTTFAPGLRRHSSRSLLGPAAVPPPGVGVAASGANGGGGGAARAAAVPSLRLPSLRALQDRPDSSGSGGSESGSSTGGGRERSGSSSSASSATSAEGGSSKHLAAVAVNTWGQASERFRRARSLWWGGKVHATDGRGIIEVRRLPPDMEARIAHNRHRLHVMAAQAEAERETSALEVETLANMAPTSRDSGDDGDPMNGSTSARALADSGVFSAAASLERAGERVLQSMEATRYRPWGQRDASRSGDLQGAAARDVDDDSSSSDSSGDDSDGGSGDDDGGGGGVGGTRSNALQARRTKGINLNRAIAKLSAVQTGGADEAAEVTGQAHHERMHLWPLSQVEDVARFALAEPILLDPAVGSLGLTGHERRAALHVELAEVDADAAATERELASILLRLEGMAAEVDGYDDAGIAEAAAILSSRSTASSGSARSAKSPRPAPALAGAGATSMGSVHVQAYAASFAFTESKSGAKRALREAIAQLKKQETTLRARMMWLQARAAELFAEGASSTR